VELLTMFAKSNVGFTTASPEWNEWTSTPGIVVPLIVSAILYGGGVLRMLHQPRQAGLSFTQPLFFATGWVSLALALLSPIHELGEQLFWVHMVQHEILILLCAPLLVLGHPLWISLWCLPFPARKAVARLGKAAVPSAVWVAVSAPACTWVLHAVALWVWHIPKLFDATLVSPAIHAAQHISFLGTGVLFWWTLLQRHGGRLGYGTRSLYLFTTAIHTSLLGALLTFSQHAWYAPYAQTASAWNLTGLEDQQLGGLIMWVPGGTVLLAVSLLMLVKWQTEAGLRGELTSTAALLRNGGTVARES
jgi:putative membrane protein